MGRIFVTVKNEWKQMDVGNREIFIVISFIYSREVGEKKIKIRRHIIALVSAKKKKKKTQK